MAKKKNIAPNALGLTLSHLDGTTVIDMNQTVASLEAILGYFDLAAQEEAIVMSPLADQDLQTFLQSVGRIREALRAMTSVNLKAGDRVVQQLVCYSCNVATSGSSDGENVLTFVVSAR